MNVAKLMTLIVWGKKAIRPDGSVWIDPAFGKPAQTFSEEAWEGLEQVVEEKINNSREIKGYHCPYCHYDGSISCGEDCIT